MARRREFLMGAVTASAVTFAGCSNRGEPVSSEEESKPEQQENTGQNETELQNSVPQSVSISDMPYSDARSYELSETGATASDSFRLENDGPTIVHADHSDEAGSDVGFTVTLESTTSDTVRPVVQVRGPYVGTVVVRPPPPSGEYELSVSAFGGEEPLSWEATVYDVPAYDDTGLSLPLNYADGLDAVIGPINFGKGTPVEASFSIDTDTASSLALINRKGEAAGTLLNKQLAGSYTRAFRAEGIGYLQIDSNTTWTVSLEQTEER